MRGGTAGLVALGILSVPNVAVAAEPVHIKPAVGENWVVNFAEDRCRLGRIFGTGDSEAYLLFEQFEPNEDVIMSVAGTPVDRVRGREVKIQFGPVQTSPVTHEPTRALFPGFGSSMIISSIAPGDDEDNDQQASDEPESFETDGLPQIDVDKAAQIHWLSLEGNDGGIVLDLPAMHDPFVILNQCTRGLVEHWGLDIERHKTMTRRAEPRNFMKMAKWIQEGYPRKALSNNEQAIVHLHAVITADGAVKDCSIADVTKTETLASPACAVFKRMSKFAPALDSQGKPMDSFYSTTIVYQLN